MISCYELGLFDKEKEVIFKKFINEIFDIDMFVHYSVPLEKQKEFYRKSMIYQFTEKKSNLQT